MSSQPRPLPSRLPNTHPPLGPRLIGVLNLTPDSFSDGWLSQSDIASSHLIAFNVGKRLFEDGADIIDLGAEATGPESKPVSVEIELFRLGNLVSKLREHGAISVDTYKALVADTVLHQGASIINDVSALRADPEMPAVLKLHQAQVILMYAKDFPLPHVSPADRTYTDVVQEIADFLKQRVDYALSSGIAESQIILDPGMGRFISHNPEYSWQLLRRFDQLVELLKPFPIVVGTSRKSFLAAGPPQERDPLSALTALHAARCGATLLRTHNVKLTRDFIETANRLRKAHMQPDIEVEKGLSHGRP